MQTFFWCKFLRKKDIYKNSLRVSYWNCNSFCFFLHIITIIHYHIFLNHIWESEIFISGVSTVATTVLGVHIKVNCAHQRKLQISPLVVLWWLCLSVPFFFMLKLIPYMTWYIWDFLVFYFLVTLIIFTLKKF